MHSLMVRSAACLALFALASSLPAEGPKIDKAQLKKLKVATVMLKVRLSDGRDVSGSGFFVHDKGLILTNAHVLGMLDNNSRRPESVKAVLDSGENDSRTLDATVLGIDRGSDLALLRVEGKGLPAPLALGSAKDLSETDELLVFGYPFGEKLGKQITVSKTSVSSFRKIGKLLTKVQVNGGMHPGNSGGPVTNLEGKVIGVAVSGIKNTQIQFAVPADLVGNFLVGRWSRFTRELPFIDGDKVLMPFVVEMNDPLGRVKKVEAEIWVGDPNKPRGASNKEPTPLEGDGPIVRTALRYDGKGIATGDALVPAKKDDKQVYYLRLVVTNGAGQTEWTRTNGGADKNLGMLLQRKEVTLSYKPKADDLTQANLSSQASFRLRDEDESDKSLALNLNAGLFEAQPKEVTEGQPTRVGLRPTSFSMTALIDKKPFKGEELKEAAKDVRLLTGELSLDEKGGVTNGTVDLRKVPRESRAILEDVGDQILQSMEVLSMPLPGEKVKPLQSWKAKRHLLLGALGLAVPAVADMQYTYLGVGKSGGRDVAVIRVSGTVTGKRGAEKGVGGRVSGTVQVDVETGLTVKSSADITADMDLTVRKALWKANGTLAVQLTRSVVVPKKK